jgi:transcriptional regulator with XRE-family HTH domain
MMGPRWDEESSAPVVPLAFWDWPPLKAALAAHHMGEVSKQYRHNPAHGRVVRQNELASWLGRTQGAISRIERSANAPHDLRLLVRYASALRIPAELLWFDLPGRELPERRNSAPLLVSRRPVEEVGETLDVSSLSEMEFIRRRLADTLGTGTATEASLDDWERTTLGYGEATRWVDSRALLSSLMADFTDLERQLSTRQPTRSQRRLCRVAAQLAGLTSLVLTKLNVHGPARSWARTARLAADEAGDPAVRAWVEAQEAYALYYGGGSPGSAVEAARLAQTLSRGPSVGTALAAALEARAHGVMGHRDEAYRALHRANDALSHLHGAARSASGFGYNEAQLRFHEGNALTHLGDVEAAWTAQKQALALYPVEDSDRVLVHLDRSIGLVRSGDAAAAVSYATDALADAPSEHRLGIVVVRTRQLVDELTQQRLSPRAVSGDVRHLLELTVGTDS